MQKYFIKLMIVGLLFFQGQTLLAQVGLNFQGVARTSNNVILASQPISLRLSILQGTASGNVEYSEVRKVTTNAQGLFAVVIGDADATNTLGSFNSINWKNTPKFLKIEMDVNAGSNYILMGTTQFQYVAYAQFAKSVDAGNINGVIPVEKGGTGVENLNGLKTLLAIDKINNTSDLEKPISAKTQAALDLILATAIDSTRFFNSINLKANTTDVTVGLASKVDKVTGKELSTNDFTNAEKTKLAAITGINTGDQDLSTYATISALGLKANVLDVNTALALKANSNDVNSALGFKANTLDVNNSLILKENSSNKSAATDLGGASPSDILYPTQKAVKAYITANAASGNIVDGGITTIKLADGAVTDAKVASINGSKVVGDISGKAASVITNANLTGVVTSVGNVTSIANGAISNTMLANTAVANLSGVNTGDETEGSIKTKLGVTGFFSGAYTDLSGKPSLFSGSYNDLTNKPDLTSKESTTNKSIDINTDAASDTKYPSVKAVKTYVDANSGAITNGSVTTIKLADGAVTDAKVASINGSKVVGDISGKAASVITNANLTGVVTSVGNVTSIANGAISNTMLANTAVANLSGVNTGDETEGSIKTKLGVTGFFSGAYTDLSGKPSLFSGSYNDLTNKPDLTSKESTTNKSIDINTDAASDTKYPSVKAVKSYVDANNGTITNGSITTVKLADGAVTDAKITSISGSKVVGDISGKAATATKLATSRNINGVSFDGSADITITASATAENLSGTTLNASITGSNLTSVGILNNATVNGKVVVGASNAASASAVLEANSTTQGFLPPRLTLAQRIAITNPVQGLMIYCTNCGTNGEPEYFNGSTWLTLAGTATSKANPTVNISVGTYTFTSGTPQGPNIATNTGTGSTYSFSYSGTGTTTYGPSTTKPTNAGTYSVTVSLSASSDGNYNAATASASFTIAKAIPIVTPTIGTYTYNLATPVAQGPNTATNTGTGATYTYSYTGTGFTTYGPSATKPTDGGTYTVIANLAASSDGNYAASSSNPTSFKIALNLALGNSYGGGKVAYILKSGDVGYDASQQHGLIISVDLTASYTDIIWGTDGVLIGASGGLDNLDPSGYSTFVELGAGINNTNLIIASEGPGTSYAAGLAKAYTGGGYTNWYLPSYSELYGIRSNSFYIGTINRTFYWTSTEDDLYNSWLIGMGGNNNFPGTKGFANGGVRAVRVF